MLSQLSTKCTINTHLHQIHATMDEYKSFLGYRIDDINPLFLKTNWCNNHQQKTTFGTSKNVGYYYVVNIFSIYIFLIFNRKLYIAFHLR